MKKLIAIILLILCTALQAIPIKDKIRKARKRKALSFKILGSASMNARIHARIRASNSVTAASARGLVQSDYITNRSRISYTVGMSNLKDLEIFVSDIELEKFIKEIK